VDLTVVDSTWSVRGSRCGEEVLVITFSLFEAREVINKSGVIVRMTKIIKIFMRNEGVTVFQGEEHQGTVGASVHADPSRDARLVPGLVVLQSLVKSVGFMEIKLRIGCTDIRCCFTTIQITFEKLVGRSCCWTSTTSTGVIIH
jgi:hypothetical protein